jgi:hypothetical protein
VFEPKAATYAIAEQMSNDLGLAEGWLNDGVKGFLAGPDPGAQVVVEAPGIRCSLGSPRMRLALKVPAHRAGEDEDDVLLLADALGLDSARAVPRFFVEEILPPE